MGLGPNLDPTGGGRSAVPGTRTDNVNGQPRGAGGGLVGRGGFSPAAVKMALGDQRAGYDMLNMFLNGTTRQGGGAFDNFMESWLGPVATAALNALTETGGMPTSADELFGQIQSGLQGNGNIYTFLSTLGQKALQSSLGGPQGEGYDTTRNAMELYAPLLTPGMTAGSRRAFGRDQDNLLREMVAPDYYDDNLNAGAMGPNGFGNADGTGDQSWGQFVQNSPFYKRYNLPGR
jgi:hypothetical protein